MRVRQTVLSPILAAFVALAGTSAGQTVSAAASQTVPMDVTRAGMVTVPVTINGAGPYTFVLDTGSNRTGISARLAARLGLQAVATTTLVSSTSTAKANVIQLGEIALGHVTRRELPTAVMPDSVLVSLGLKADGVLGQDFLADNTYTLDYERGRLSWDAAQTARAPRLVLRRDEGRWLVGLPQGKRGEDMLWFVPDSGAQALVLFDRGVRLPFHLRSLPDVAVSTVAGGADASAALVQTLRVGAIELTDQPAVVIQRRGPDAPAGDGLLPLSMFASVTFNAREGYLAVRSKSSR